MLKNFIKITLRNIVRFKTYTLINMAGLALGMTCVILIFLWVQYEWSYARFHKNADRLYRVAFTTERKDYHGYYQPGPLAEYLKANFPEFVQTTNFSEMPWKLSYDLKGLFCNGSYVDAAFFDMFSFPLERGNSTTVLAAPYSIAISNSLARKMFGTNDPLGKTIKLNDQTDVTVTGVFKDVPKTSHIQFDFVIPFQIAPEWMKMWDRKCVQTYVLLQKNSSVDENFLKTFQMRMSQGRFFSKEFPSDYSEAFVVNEAAVKAMAIADPVGKPLTTWFGRKGTIVGVVRDFHTESLHTELAPLVLIPTESANYMCVRIKAVDISYTLKFIEGTIREFILDDPFEFTFLDKQIDSLYRAEQTTLQLATFIALLAIFLSCLGLFGLALFFVEQRTKEIGIRKVLGASIFNILIILNKGLTRWIIIANLIAWPVAWYAAHKWLQNYVYRINMNFWIFLLAGASALALALMTVSWQSFRAAIANPVNTLRYE